MAKVLDDSRQTADPSSRRRILIADDDGAIRSLLKDFLGGEGFETVEARSGKEVLQAASVASPDLMLLDLRMPDWDGMEVMRRLKERDLGVPVILMTAYGTSSSAIQAIQLGAFDYITKPFELEDVLLTVQRFFEHDRLASEVRKLRGQLEGRDLTERIIGSTPAMQEVYKLIGRVAQTDATVLITGETGTGKELVAESLHLYSTYRDGPLVKVNCAALPETLLENELFGHEKGSFTGAATQAKGRFEMAHKGTIFLDEIGEMTLGTQKKLLRVLQEKEFERVGGTVPVKVDCRVIAATNKNLRHEVDQGNFREDLFYRLNVIRIFMPPLRERQEDVPLLVEHFLNKHRYTAGSPPARISEDAMQALLEHQWPGNVRELEHAVQRAVVMSQGGVITREHLQVDPSGEVGVINLDQKLQQGQDLAQIMAGIESYLVGHALERSRGNRHQAAKLLGLDLAALERKLAEHGLASD
ncbi:MAG TPA: sigma-54 dependent transcriptional regulator [Chloroflexota bacterium]|nr:sigma-54 dependent transcriptional regulator [Chloroflexota bacterium]